MLFVELWHGLLKVAWEGFSCCHGSLVCLEQMIFHATHICYHYYLFVSPYLECLSQIIVPGAPIQYFQMITKCRKRLWGHIAESLCVDFHVLQELQAYLLSLQSRSCETNTLGSRRLCACVSSHSAQGLSEGIFQSILLYGRRCVHMCLVPVSVCVLEKQIKNLIWHIWRYT